MTVNGEAGPWPTEFPVGTNGHVATGLVVRSLSGEIEGRTTGGRRPCISEGCPGWFIGVKWETGQQMHICSEGWKYDPNTGSIRVTGGGEISARFVSPEPLGTPPLPRSQWPDRATLGPAWLAVVASSDAASDDATTDRVVPDAGFYMKVPRPYNEMTDEERSDFAMALATKMIGIAKANVGEPGSQSPSQITVSGSPESGQAHESSPVQLNPAMKNPFRYFAMTNGNETFGLSRLDTAQMLGERFSLITQEWEQSQEHHGWVIDFLTGRDFDGYEVNEVDARRILDLLKAGQVIDR